MGAANPLCAARAVRQIGKDLGLRTLSTAAIVGDSVEEIVRQYPQLALLEGEPLESILPRMVSANAYLGADVIRNALATERSEERRVGKEGVNRCEYRWSP